MVSNDDDFRLPWQLSKKPVVCAFIGYPGLLQPIAVQSGSRQDLPMRACRRRRLPAVALQSTALKGRVVALAADRSSEKSR